MNRQGRKGAQRKVWLEVAAYMLTLALCFLSPATRAGTAWEDYLSLPTPENASKVTTFAYSPQSLPLKYGYWAPHLDVLKTQIMSGDRESFRLAYRLLEKSDGGLLEELTAILGSSIRPQPEVFLREMASLSPPQKRLKSILIMPGLEYTDLPEAARYEIEMRRKAIISITDERLMSQKELCLSLMAK